MPSAPKKGIFSPVSASKPEKEALLDPKLGFRSTEEVPVSDRLIDQVIGQDNCVDIIRKAAAQKRNVLLIGLPGTGKSLLAQAMSEILPVQKLSDILIYPNIADPNNPKVRIVKAGDGKKIVHQLRLEALAEDDNVRTMSLLLSFAWFIFSYLIWKWNWISDIIYAALLVLGALVLLGFGLSSQMRPRLVRNTPKLLVDNFGKKLAPFFEATGARAGALLGDVRHDPLQSFSPMNKLMIKLEGILEEISFENLWKRVEEKYPDLIEVHEKGYQAIVFPANENIFVHGYKDGKIVLSRIYSMNRRSYEGKIVDIQSGENTISLTPEHKVVTAKESKMAEKISPADSLINLDVKKQLAVER